MSVRRNNYGPRPAEGSRGFGGAIEATRVALSLQPAGAGFKSVPPTEQWKCHCGFPNPASRARCRACGEDKKS